MRATFIGLLCGLLSACDERGGTALGEVEFVCDEVIEANGAPSCEFVVGDDASVRLWVPREQPRVWIDGAVVGPSRAVEVEGGWHLQVAIPAGASSLEVEAPGQAGRTWSLALRWRGSERPPPSAASAFAAAEWRECERLARRDFEAIVAQGRSAMALRVARTGVECALRAGEGSDVARWRELASRVPTRPGYVDALRAQIEAEALAHEGALRELVGIREASVARASRVGLPLLAVEELSGLASVLLEISEVDAAVAASTEALARTLGSSRRDRCMDGQSYNNLGWAQIQAATVSRDGARWGAAEVALKEALRAFEEGECAGEDAAMAHLNLAWIGLVGGDLVGAGERLRAVEGLQERSPGVRGALRAESSVVRARLALAEGRVATARAAIDGIAGEGLPVELELLRASLDAEIREAEGDLEGARGVYADVQRRVLERLSALGREQAPQRFVFDRLRSARRLARLLWVGGDARRAMEVVRRAATAEARLVAGRQESARLSRRSQRGDLRALRDAAEGLAIDLWAQNSESRAARMSAASEKVLRVEDEALGERVKVDLMARPFSEPSEGEVLLLYVPAEGERWLGFAASRDRVEVAEIDPAGMSRPSIVGDRAALESWSDHLLAPFSGLLAGAERVRVLPSFGVEAIPFHALPWRGGSLLEQGAVVLSLDLGEVEGETSRDRRSSRVGQARALVVGDPLGDLARARMEAEGAREALVGRGLEAELLIGKDASGPRVRARLPEVDLFHFAGHSERAGRFGWRSQLLLGPRGVGDRRPPSERALTSLTLADALSMEAVPSAVVLLSCQSGGASPDPRAPTIAVASAFLIAGSSTVVAAMTDLSDDEAGAVARALYGATPRAEIDLSAAYRAAMLEVRGELSAQAWQSVRVWAR